MPNRIIRIAAALSGCILFATGCVRREALDTDSEAIRFTAGATLLRDDALPTKTNSPLSEPVIFGVFSYLQSGTVGSPGSWNNNRTPNFMFNLGVTFNGSSYTYSPTRFWPSPGNTLSFWAYSPWVATPDLRVANSNNAFTSNSKKLPDIHLTVDGHTDYRITNLVKNLDTNSGTVNLPFNHTLSLIDVYADKDDVSGHYTVTLKSVRFDGLYMTGLLRWNSSPNTWDWASLSGSRQNVTVWADNPNTDSDNVILAHSSDNAHSSAILLNSTSQTKLMLLPQSLSDDACRLHVEFTLSYTTHDDVLDEDIPHNVDTSRDVYLRDVFENLPSVTWIKNTRYTLTITISPNKPILFTVTWSDWGDAHNYFLSN